MRLHVAVREGDRVATSYSPVGATIARHMTALGAFDVRGFDPHHVDPDTGWRWKRLDSAVLARTCAVDVAADTPVTALIRRALAAARAAQLARNDEEECVGIFAAGRVLHVWLTDPATDAPVADTGSVRDAGLADGDLVMLCIRRETDTPHRLLPAPTPEHLFSRLVRNERPAGSNDEPTLHGLLLYTEADVELATFVRTQFDELNALTGSLLRIFVTERPSEWAAAKAYWRPRLEPELYRSLAALRWLRWVPHERSRAYDVARRLHVPVDALPCLVLFADHEQDRKLVFPLGELTTSGVRRLVREIAAVVGADGARYDMEQGYESTRGAAWALPEAKGEPAGFGELLLAEQRLYDALRPEAAAHRFRFHDHPVFVYETGRQPRSGEGAAAIGHRLRRSGQRG